METFTLYLPFLPSCLKFCFLVLNFVFLHFGSCHVRVKLLMLFVLKFGMLIRNNFVNLVDLLLNHIRKQENSSMWKTIELSEGNLKLLKVFKGFGQGIMNYVETFGFDKREEKINVWRPPFEGWIILLTNLLQWSDTLFSNDCQGCVGHKFKFRNHDMLYDI